ncbi:hypothetical protein GCM10023231_04590 [Olivibacter ginsenosidimutans]|uniref:Leucine-binding protein domain-containing protein n=1 Tax=Olivibacter ginsenosidimutans TaxID=1176537 RepID=A0ABP9AG62_9SPHI
MILVQNHRLLSSGSKLLAVLFLCGFLGACAPKILRPGGKGPKEPSKESPTKKEEKPEEKKEAKAPIQFNNIALLLPFQLDKVIDSLPNSRDVERSALALDFYQGFKLGLDQVAKAGDNFKLHVLDTRDNILEVQKIAVDTNISAAQIVVGPVFPTEINAFSGRANLSGKLQISPLAASSPVGNQVNNLVTVTPTIAVHADVIGHYVAKQYGSAADHVVIFNNNDEDSRKLLDPLKAVLDQLNVHYVEINELGDMETSLGAIGKNVVINASTNQFFVAPLLADLARLKTEQSYDITLIGHPNWNKLDLNPDHLETLNTCISSSYYVDENSTATGVFRANYVKAFNVAPSEFAYKGYDTGVFFAKLLAKYPKDYVEHLVKEKHKGVAIGFAFVFNPTTGYVNNSVRLLRFNRRAYRPLP